MSDSMNPYDVNNPASPEYQRLADLSRNIGEKFDQRIAPILAAEQERSDYYRALREKYSDYNYLGLRNRDYDYIDAAQRVINHPGFEGDAELERDRLYAAAIYANNLQKPIEMVYQNLDIFHEQWTGRKFVAKSGIKAVIDSIGFSFLSLKHSGLAIAYHTSGQDPEVLKRLLENKQRMEELRDNVPKVWHDEYIRQGGIADVLAFGRNILNIAAENAAPIAMSAATGGLLGAGAGAATKALSLPAGLSGKIIAGASMLGMAESTAFQTVGTEYFDLISQGIPDDIAWTNANISAQIQGAIEAVGGGVVSTTTKRLLKSTAPGIVEKAVARWFIKGKPGAASKAVLDYLQEIAGEGFEEGVQQITSIASYNMAAAQANRRRDELLQELYDEPIEEIRKNLEKELEKYPEFDQKEFDEIMDEVRESVIGGMGTALILGIPAARIGYKNNVRAASRLADMAQKAPSAAAFIEDEKKAEAEGFNNPFTEGMRTDEKAAVLSEIHRVQQEHMTPEQREAKQKAAQDAAALAEVTDYSNADVEDTPEIDENGKETGGTQQEIVTHTEGSIYRNDAGRLETSEYTDTNEDGSVNGRFVAGDPRTPTEDGNQYGYINYTETDDAVTVDEFKMLSGYESLRPDLFRQFAERFAGKNIQWTPQNEQNLGIKDQLVNANPRGPKEGLNYYEQGSQVQASAEARQIADRFRPYLKNSTPLETALAVETFGAFYRRRGESLNGAMNRLLGKITNEAPESVIAAQRAGKTVKGATWIEQTAEGMRRIVYVNKNAADSSTVVHEISHAVAADFTEAERSIAASALNGYTLKNGETVSFEEGGGPWTDAQHEAFAEALENYLTNGTAPNEEIKGLFERIKEFMKRVYRTMKGWTELSPEAERFYKSLLSGELVDEANAENSPQAHEEGRREARDGKRENDTAEGETAPESLFFENDELNEAFKRMADGFNRMNLEKAQEILRLREAVITDPDVSPDDKARAVMDAAGRALLQAAEIDADENPVEYLKARLPAGTAERNRITGQIDELARIYPPETNKYLAPNGKPSNLNHAQWYAVRTPSFKEWFGDWERAAGIAELEKAANIVLDGEAYQGKYDISGSPKENKKSIETYLKSLKGLENIHINGPIKLGSAGIGKITSWGMNNQAYLKTIAHIPAMLKNAVLISENGPNRANSHYQNFRHLVTGIELEGEPYTVHIVLGENAGIWYYQHILSKIGKGSLIDVIRETNSGHRASLPDTIKDTTLLDILQAPGERKKPEGVLEENVSQTGKGRLLAGIQATIPGHPKASLSDTVKDTTFLEILYTPEVSQVRDANGEPLVVYHGTRTEFEAFSLEKAGTRRDPGMLGKWFYFSTDKYAASAGDPITLTLFANAKNPLYVKMDKWSQGKTEIVSKALGLEDTKDSTEIRNKIIQSGYDAVVLDYSPLGYKHQEIMMLNPEQIKSATNNAGAFDTANPSILFQDDYRDMVEEAAEFENGKEYRAYVEFMYDGSIPGYEIETAGLSDAALNAWYDEFVSKAKIAVESSSQTEGAESMRQESVSPAEKDKSFIEMISETKARDDFFSMLKNYTSGERYGYTEEDIDSGRAEKLHDLIQGKLKHPLWTMFFMAQGEIKESHKKKLLGLIRKYPRDYRAIYSEVMERPEFAVSAEDTTAEILKHRISDSRRETVDTLSPEKLSQLSEQLDVEEYAETVRKGTAKLVDPREKKLVKSLDAQIVELETQLKKEEADRKEENEYLHRQVSSQFLKTFENVLAAAEELEEAKGEVDQAIKTGREDLGKIARSAAKAQANYWSITEKLDAYKEAQDLGLHVRELLNEAKLADYAKSAKEQARMARQDAKQELADYAQSAREQNTMARLLHKAETAQMKADLKEKHRQQEAIKRLRAEDKRNLAVIFQTPGASVAHDYGKAIGLIQRLFKATMDTTVKAIGEDAADYGLDTIMQRIDEEYGEGSAKETEEAALKYLPSQVFYRIQDKPLSAWTIEERRELAGIIAGLAREGRELRKAQIAEYNRRIAAEKAAIAKTIKTVTDSKLQDHPEDTPEEKERKRKEREVIVNAYQYGIPGTAQAADARRKFKPPRLDGFLKYNYMDNSRFVEYVLDGGAEDGPSSALLTRRYNTAWNQKQAAIDTRMKMMQDATGKNGVSVADLYRKVAELDLGGAIGKQNFTVNELIGVMLAIQNEYSDAAFRTGNLLHRTERNAWIKQMAGIEDEVQRDKLDAGYMTLSTQRYNAITSAAKSFFEKEENKKFLPVIETMRKDYAANAKRINDGLIEYNNTEIQPQKNYYPIDRVEPTSAYVQDSKLMRELVGSAASGFQMYVERGFTKGRIKIPPQFQSAINLDAMSVWLNSVNAQEHFLAYGQLVKEVNRIYKDPNSEARIWIRQRYGEDGVKRLDRLIKDMVSDGQGHESTALDDVVRVFRKNYSTAVLGFRVISGLKQVITSPAAFMGQGITPWEYLAAHLDYITHQKERWNEIAVLSEIMEHRSANILIDEVKQEAATAADPKKRRLARFRKASMVFQEIADNITVAPGWYLLYKKEFNRLTEGKETAKLDVKDRQVKAVEYADKIITRIQPTGRAQDIAPIFKDNGELGKAYLQFTQQLSLIFQDLYYDTPVQIRRGQIKNVIGKCIGFITAGLLVGLLTEAADGIGDDDDDEKKAARFIAYGISQFTDSIPLIGTSATDTINLIATGRMQYHVNGSPLKALESGAQSVQNIVRAVQQSDSEKAIKALQQGLTTLGYINGLPAAQFNDLIKTIQKMAGE